MNLTEAKLFAGRAVNRDWYFDIVSAATMPKMATGCLVKMRQHKESLVCRLPDDDLPSTLAFEYSVALRQKGDSPIWVCLTMEDGQKDWSSPIYFVR